MKSKDKRVGKQWEDQSDEQLKKEIVILKRNKSRDDNMVKTNSTYENSKTGQKFTPEHYKENSKVEKQAIERAQNELNKRKKIKALKDRAVKIGDERSKLLKKRDRVDEELES